MRLTGIAITATLLMFATTSCAAGGAQQTAGSPVATATVTRTVTAAPAPDSTEDEEVEPIYDPVADLKPRDFKLRVKVTDKQCFGSAGCLIDYQIEPTYQGLASDLDDAVIDVTYEITGDESGTMIGTLSLDGGSYSSPTGSASTTGNSVELVAKATEVYAY